MEKINWGIMGTANIARWATIPGMKLAPNARLYAVAGRSLEKAKSYADEYGFDKYYGSYQELLQDDKVQAVYIPLPNNLHLQWVTAALKAKKHVLCEKPLALTEAEARLMFKTAEENGVYLMEAYAYLHGPYVKSLKEDVRNGLIGDVDFIDTAFVTQGYKEDIRLYKELGGGAVYDLGCYCTTMILSLIDSEPVSVKAAAEFTDKGVDEITTGFIRFKNGARASFNVGMILGQNTNARFDRLYIHGTKGFIKSEVEYNQAGAVTYQIFTEKGLTERKIDVPQNYSLEIEQLGSCILSGEKTYVTADFSIKNAKLMDSIFKEIGY
ncbi:MAG: Gfo/Idh/MocA family oxidoreductase [Treponemataceae bacterium]|nr:Gfo/Idh/MocA family oxidoreductase [Treponemataceae bacterium]